jgi:hypothetical protein
MTALARRSSVLVVVALLSITACGAEADVTGLDESGVDDQDRDDQDRDDQYRDDGNDVVAAFADDCSQEALSGDDQEYAFVAAYRITDGELGELCLGTEDDTVLGAWESLAAITPPGQLGDLTLFGGFEPDGDGAAETLAYVNVLDADGTSFQMSVNTIEAVADPEELLLTLAHEFAHVFTGISTQLDRSDEAIEACATYFNGEGCFLDDALITAWIDAFWPPELVETVDPFEDSADDAEERCAVDSGFFGPYAATNPEEDFAEAFSAFVFRLTPNTDGQAARLDWIEQQPGLLEFRTRADAAGLTPLANRFELCGA